jgi:hypothetical protein
MGPVINAAACRRILGMIERAGTWHRVPITFTPASPVGGTSFVL